MQSIDAAVAPRPDGDVRLVSLQSRAVLPARVRSLLEGVLALSGGLFERWLSLSLNEHEQQLFKLAEKARSGNEQQAVFESLREIKRGRADVAPRFMLFVESALTEFDARPAAAAAPKRFQELALVETRDLEETIALQEMTAKAEIRHSQALYALGHRFGVLAGAPALDAESLPLGPQRLGAALRYAAACLGIPLEHRLLLYRLFDRLGMSEAGVLFSAVNDYLAEKRILRHLQTAQRYSVPTPAAGHAANGTDKAQPATDADTAASATAATAASPAATPRTAAPLSAAASESFAGDGEDLRDSELFDTLRELLAGRRHLMPAATSGGGASLSDYVASGDDLQAVLGSLQNRPAAPLVLGGRVVQRSVAHLKQDLLNQLRHFTPDGRPPQLSDVDADTLDLVGMLFDFLAKDMRPTSATQALLTKLQVPVLRVALRDKNFFTRRSHPARQLLNAVAETGQHWIDDGDGEADRLLVEKMQLVVDRVGSEFDGREELFDELLTDLSRHMGTLARKAEVAERRHIDAAKGRERLDVAREGAVQAVTERLRERKVPRLVRSLLEQAWTDVLALTILRQGQDSDIYRRRLDVVDRLVAGTAADDAELRGEIEQGLGQVGFHGDDVQSMLLQLVDGGEAARDDSTASRTELALKLKNKTRLGEDTPPADPARTARAAAVATAAPAATLPTDTSASVTPATAATAAETPLTAAPFTTASITAAPAAATPIHAVIADPPAPTAEERQILERLKTLPYGTWFEFVTNQQGDTVRRKLSWFSTLTGRCLFVNQRGARTDERSLQQLARDIVRGQAHIVVEQRESLIDRAWSTIVGTLRQLSGKPAPQPVT